jgi:hypothetical protein
VAGNPKGTIPRHRYEPSAANYDESVANFEPAASQRAKTKADGDPKTLEFDMAIRQTEHQGRPSVPTAWRSVCVYIYIYAFRQL